MSTDLRRTVVCVNSEERRSVVEVEEDFSLRVNDISESLTITDLSTSTDTIVVGFDVPVYKDTYWDDVDLAQEER